MNYPFSAIQNSDIFFYPPHKALLLFDPDVEYQ